MMQTSIITVNYNSGTALKEMLDSLLPQKRGDVEIIIVDNASVDDSIALITSYQDRARLIQSPDNEGFSKGVNRGLTVASGKFILLLNPDTIVNEGALAALEQFMAENTEAGIAGGRVRETDGSLQPACRRAFPSPWVAFCRLSGLGRLFPKSKIFDRYNLMFLDENATNEVDAVSGSFMMIRKDVIDQIGRFDEDYFLYAEDIDFCFRAKQSGWKNYYFPGAVVTHKKGVSAETNRVRAMYEFYNTMWTFHKKHYLRRTFPPVNLAIYLGIWFLKTVKPALAARRQPKQKVESRK